MAGKEMPVSYRIKIIGMLLEKSKEKVLLWIRK